MYLFDMHIYIIFIFRIIETLHSLLQTDSTLRSLFWSTYNSPLFVRITAKTLRCLKKNRKRCHRIICDKNCSCEYFDELKNRRNQEALRMLLQMQDPSHILYKLIPHRLQRTKHFYIKAVNSERRLTSFGLFICTAFLVTRWINKSLYQFLFKCLQKLFSIVTFSTNSAIIHSCELP